MLYLKNLYHFFLAWLGDFVYRHPSRRLLVVGITGTKGKTTSVELLRAVFERAGKKTAMLSSAHIAYGQEIVPSPTSNTMPGRFFIQRFLGEAVKKGCTHAMFEVTSQGVVQHRHRFIDFDVAAVTCLHPEHIESHGGYEQYRGAKVKFFKDVAQLSSKTHKKFFINSEMSGGGDAQFFEDAVRHTSASPMYYSKENFVRNELHGDKTKVSEWLRSDFNLENAALVFAIAREAGVSAETILAVFKDFFGVAGRLEFVRTKNRTAVIDYALTPGSLRVLYKHLRSIPPLEKGEGLKGGGFKSLPATAVLPFEKGVPQSDRRIR
jgi:UDP-N-acetylmuramoyl-L-alanyl-D-glutamate--2,6-diaminopimelate ligase